jgi:hypothetical protein
LRFAGELRGRDRSSWRDGSARVAVTAPDGWRVLSVMWFGV